MSVTNKSWDTVYSRNFMTNWYPNENIIRFCARLIQKRLTYDKVEIKRKVSRVLDLGCGNGRHAIYFAREGMEASGIDISETAIEWAKDWSNREGFAIDFRVGSITELPYPDQHFDVVVSHGVLDHIRMDDATQAVREVARVLPSGGLFYFDLKSADDSEFGVGEEAATNTFVVTDGFEKGLIQHFFTLDEIHQLMGEHFRPIYIETHDHRLAPDFTRMIARWIVAAERL
jgi:2-polyprenyl-3-methyl-5-hydroxy-6-metoxy-1,4-benzoquinol methylase